MKTASMWIASALFASVLSLDAQQDIAEIKATIAKREAEVAQLKQHLADLEKKQTAQPAAVTNQAPPEARPNPPAATYKVKAGDSWDKIARKNGTTPAKLARANGMKLSKMLHPGDTLKLPGSPANQANPVAEKPQINPSRSISHDGSYVVKEGDTYLKIAKKMNVSAEALMAANPETKANELRPGQTIRIDQASPSDGIRKLTGEPPKPLNVQDAATPLPVINRPTTHQAPAQDPSPIPIKDPADAKIRAVTIQQDMTFINFARIHQTDVDRLNALNGLELTENTLLAKGSELYVPVP